MTRYTNTLEGGTNGTRISVGNSGGASGDAFSGVSRGAASDHTYTTAQKAHGSFGAYFDGAASETAWAVHTLTPAGSLSVRGYVRFPSVTPAASEIFCRIRSLSADASSFVITTASKLRVFSATSATLWTSTASVSVDTWYRFEAIVTKGTTTSNGRVQFKFFSLDSTTAIESYDSGATVDAGTADITYARWGRLQNVAAAFAFYMDDLAAEDSASFIGPVPANLKPIASGAARQSVNAGAAVTLSWSQSDPDGTIASNAVTQTSGTTVTLSGSSGTGSTGSRTFTAPAAGAVLVFSITTTDNLGAVSDPFIHTVYVRHATLKVYEEVSNPGGSTAVGAADKVTAISDASDSTYSQTVDNPSSAIEWYRLTPAASGAITMRAREKVDTGSPARALTVQLVQGPTTSGTVIATIGPITPTTSAADYTHVCTSGEMAAVTDQDQLLYKVSTS